jgi:FimV-like protein
MNVTLKTFGKGLLLAALLAACCPAWGQAAGSAYTVRKGDTLSGIARKTKPEGVDRAQMMLGIRRANPAAFPDGNIDRLRVGQILVIPGAGEIGAPGSFAAATRYREGLALERRGDQQGAFKAFLDAGEGGHGLAQRKLGEIYDKGGPVERDYETSLQWYGKARAQGVPIPKPFVRSPYP